MYESNCELSLKRKSELKVGQPLMRRHQISDQRYLEPVPRLSNCHFGQLDSLGAYVHVDEHS